jgi:hypothetical protein
MTDPRTAVMTLVEASWEDSSGTLQTVSARMEDKSAGGACIRIKTPIGVGARLRIQWRFDRFSGTAKYCRGEGREYVVGIQRDSVESPIFTRPSLATPPAQKSLTSGDLPVSIVKSQGPPQPESQPHEIPAAGRNLGTTSTGHLTSATIAMPADGLSHEDREDRPEHRLRDVRALRRTQIPTQQPPQRAAKERKSMARKWLDLAWSNKPEALAAAAPEIAEANSNGNNDKENLMSHVNQTTENVSAHSAREVPTFQVELSSMEDIYRAAGIMIPRKGYSIKKVVDMLNSEHMSGLAKEMKRVALLMALDAAGVPLDEVLQDAKIRQQALDAYEAAQQMQVEAEWARKAEEVVQIQAELKSIEAHYMARIGRSQEGVDREKATFNGWLKLKQQESQSIAEAAELCSKSSVSDTANAPPEVGMAKAAAAGASGAQPEARSDAIH